MRLKAPLSTLALHRFVVRETKKKARRRSGAPDGRGDLLHQHRAELFRLGGVQSALLVAVRIDLLAQSRLVGGAAVALDERAKVRVGIGQRSFVSRVKLGRVEHAVSQRAAEPVDKAGGEKGGTARSVRGPLASARQKGGGAYVSS